MEINKAWADIVSAKSSIRDARVVLLSYVLSDDCKYPGLLRVTDHLLNAAERECNGALDALKNQNSPLI